jgi:hypothetical protein
MPEWRILGESILRAADGDQNVGRTLTNKDERKRGTVALFFVILKAQFMMLEPGRLVARPKELADPPGLDAIVAAGTAWRGSAIWWSL